MNFEKICKMRTYTIFQNTIGVCAHFWSFFSDLTLILIKMNFSEIKIIANPNISGSLPLGFSSIFFWICVADISLILKAKFKVTSVFRKKKMKMFLFPNTNIFWLMKHVSKYLIRWNRIFIAAILMGTLFGYVDNIMIICWHGSLCQFLPFSINQGKYKCLQ